MSGSGRAAAGIRDVAAAASVSVGTVSNVLNAPHKVAPSTVARVHAAIAELGFVRNDVARQLKARRSRCVALLVLDVGNPFFTDIARAAEDRAAQENLIVLLGTSDDDLRRERAYIDAFDELRVYGLLVSPIGDDLSRLTTMRARGTPVVLVDRDGSGGEFGAGSGTEFDSVAVDDVAGAESAVRHLCEQGRRRIAVVTGPRELRQVRDRLRGAQQAIAAVPGASLEVLEVPALTVLEGRAAGEKIRDRPSRRRPDAVFCANDLLAIGMLQALAPTGGLRVPDDIAVVGYDDIDFAGSGVVPLTSVRQPRQAIGATAIDLLLGAADDGPDHRPVHILFQPELIERASSVIGASL